MEYRNRAKNRRLKRIITQTIDNFKFKGVNLSLDGKCIFLGGILSLVSLFTTWVEVSNGNITGNSFSNLVGSIGYLLFFLIIGSIIITFSHSKKEKLKMSIDAHFHDYNIILNFGFFIVTLGLISLRYINGLSTLSEGIIYGQGPIICIVGGISIFVGGLIMKKKQNERNIGIYMSEVESGNEEETKESNMKLPF